MQQIIFPFENDPATDPDPPMAGEQEQQLIELMAQAILALLHQQPCHREERGHRVPGRTPPSRCGNV